MKWHRDEGLGREQNRWAMKSSEEKQRVAKVEWLKVVLGREVVLDRGILYRDEQIFTYKALPVVIIEILQDSRDDGLLVIKWTESSKSGYPPGKYVCNIREVETANSYQEKQRFSD